MLSRVEQVIFVDGAHWDKNSLKKQNWWSIVAVYSLHTVFLETEESRDGQECILLFQAGAGRNISKKPL